MRESSGGFLVTSSEGHESRISADWSGGFARRKPDGRYETWGTYRTPDGTVVRLYRGRYNRCRFYDETGTQHGPEQSNVYPAVCYAASQSWFDLGVSADWNVAMWLEVEAKTARH